MQKFPLKKISFIGQTKRHRNIQIIQLLKELETDENIVCHSLRLKWLSTQFHDKLADIPECGLTNFIGFITGIRWMRERH